MNGVSSVCRYSDRKGTISLEVMYAFVFKRRCITSYASLLAYTCLSLLLYLSFWCKVETRANLKRKTRHKDIIAGRVATDRGTIKPDRSLLEESQTSHVRAGQLLAANDIRAAHRSRAAVSQIEVRDDSLGESRCRNQCVNSRLGTRRNDNTKTTTQRASRGASRLPPQAQATVV